MILRIRWDLVEEVSKEDIEFKFNNLKNDRWKIFIDKYLVLGKLLYFLGVNFF